MSTAVKQKDDLQPATSINRGNVTVPAYLGELAGEREWNGNSVLANRQFINLDAYNLFREPEYLLLVGRTGTGKSAILNKLKYEIEHKIDSNNSIYKDVIYLDFREYINQLTKLEKIDNSENNYSDISENIKQYINIVVMQHLFYNPKYKNYTKQLTNIKSYLNQLNIKKNTDINILAKIFLCGLDNSDTLFKNEFGLISLLTQFGYKKSYEKACVELKNVFNENKILVLIDTLEYYDFNSISTTVIVRSLIDICFDYHIKNNFISIKAALPSELYSYIRTQLPAKKISNTVFIEWKFKDLVKLIASRLYILCKDSKYSTPETYAIVSQFHYNKILNHYLSAKEFIYKFFPEKCKATLNLSFDTLSYIMRHTQKKPRQLMLIFNSILHPIISERKTNYYFINREKLKDSIHLTQENLIIDALNMYNSTYDNIVNVCETVLKRKQFYMSSAKLKEILKQSVKYNISDDNLMNVLIESGLIGIVIDEKKHTIEQNNAWFENPNEIEIIPTLYEYQVKGRLVYTDKSNFVIHPMCYEQYNIYINHDVLVYPESYDDTDETYAYLQELLRIK